MIRLTLPTTLGGFHDCAELWWAMTGG